MDCPACYVALGDAQHLKGARVYLLDHDHEINCILKKLHAIDPNLQLRFIDLLRKKQPTISLQDFSHKHDLDSSVFTECKDCKILTIGVKELSFYVMGKFITKVPKEH